MPRAGKTEFPRGRPLTVRNGNAGWPLVSGFRIRSGCLNDQAAMSYAALIPPITNDPG